MRDPLGAAATVEVRRDVPYATPPERRLHLDLYAPAPPHGRGSRARRAAVVLLHGGGWRDGDRRDLTRYGLALADRGFVCAVPDYRSSEAATFPAQIRDAKAAIRWLRSNASTAGVETSRVGAFGVDAGAHLAVLAALTPDDEGFRPVPETLDAADGRTDALGAVVGVAGLYNFEHTPERETLRALLGGTRTEVPDAYERASPSTHLADDAPPTLLLHGEEDDVVPAMASELFYDGLEAATSDAECAVAAETGHDVHETRFDWTLSWTAGFLDRHLR
jgi:acetyl esterase/lipase